MSAFTQMVLGQQYQPPEAKVKKPAKAEERKTADRTYAKKRYVQKLLLIPYNEFTPLDVAAMFNVPLPTAHYNVKKMVYYKLIEQVKHGVYRRAKE